MLNSIFDVVNKVAIEAAKNAQPKNTGVSDEDVRAWLQANNNADDYTIAKAMQEHGVNSSQMARATGVDKNLIWERFNNALDKAAATPKNVVPVSSPTIIDQGIAQPNTPVDTRPPNIDPSFATTTAQNVLGGGIPQQPQIPQYARQPWMNNPIPPQYQQMTRQQMQPPSWYSQTPPWVQQMQSWGRQQPQQQPPMPPQYQQPQMCQAPQQLRYAQPTYGRY
jgi:hypothetical protein